MNLIEITSLDDERVAAFARLTEAQLRNRIEPELGVFIAESPKVIQRALDAGMEALAFLMERDKLPLAEPLVAQAETQQALTQREPVLFGQEPTPRVQALREQALRGQELKESTEKLALREGQPSGLQVGGIPVYTGSTKALQALTGFELTRGVLCAMRRPALPGVEELLATCRGGKPARRVAVLEAIVDHTNVGAIFRSAAALGVDAVLVTPTCCDPLYRRCVRVSMGTVFQVPWTRIGKRVGDWPEVGIAQLQAAGFKTVALALSDDALAIDAPELAAEERLALVLGTEGDGLASATIASCDYVAKIPMRPGVDSLNVAAASAVAFWQLRV